ncbi:hypothetical protein D3C71_77490 [compost metagenome]
MPITKENVIIQFSDVPNQRTGNVYPLEILEQIAAKGVKARMGELRTGKPGDVAETQNLAGLGVINIANASHQVSDLRVVDGALVGTVTTLETTKGEELEKLLNDPEKEVTFALRGFGDMTPERQITMFEMVTVDAVDVSA